MKIEKYDFYFEGFNVHSGKTYGTWKDATMNELNKLIKDYYIESVQWIEYIERIDDVNNEVKKIFFKN